MKVLSLFSGIGAYEKALKNIGIEFELINYCDFDKRKSKAYALLHNEPESKNLVDVTTIDLSKLDDFDLLVYSPPCTSFSISGKRDGVEGVTGGLFYDALKVIEGKKPKYAVMENVDNLVNNFRETFDDMLNRLEKLGYNNYWKIINAKDFIPQNRKRVYIVSIRKDIDINNFEFPIGNDKRHWTNIIDPLECRGITSSQQKFINYALGKDNGQPYKFEGMVQFDCAVITLRRSGLRFQNNREYPTLTASYGKGGGGFTIMAYKGHYGGIKPRQCFKLMGFDYSDCDILEQNGFSTSALYVMAGDSVVVPVLEGIFKNLFKTTKIN